jgi:hypothetical protein
VAHELEVSQATHQAEGGYKEENNHYPQAFGDAVALFCHYLPSAKLLNIGYRVFPSVCSMCFRCV